MKNYEATIATPPDLDVRVAGAAGGCTGRGELSPRAAPMAQAAAAGDRTDYVLDPVAA